MSTEIALPKGFGAISSVFGNSNAGTNDELGAGVNASYAVVGYKGKVWSIRYSGTDTPLMRDDGDGPRNSIEVVLLKASAAISKIFYKQGYVEGSNAAPDCWSADGVKPDASVQNKCHTTCADCPMNAWGSRVTESGKQGKQCSDSRRVAIAPSGDLENEAFGGPMLLRVPAASLKDLKAYGDLLSSYQYPYYAAVTRVSFDPKEAYPKFVFNAVRPLTDAEAARVLALRDDKRVSAVLSESASTAGVGVAGDAPKPVPASPFEQDTPATKAETPAPAEDEAAKKAKADALAEKKRKAAQAAAEAARLAAEAEAELEEEAAAASGITTPEPTEDTTLAGNAPASFDDMLDKLL